MSVTIPSSTRFLLVLLQFHGLTRLRLEELHPDDPRWILPQDAPRMDPLPRHHSELHQRKVQYSKLHLQGAAGTCLGS